MAITPAQLRVHQLSLQPAGCIPLKGKQGEMKVYRPEVVVNQEGGIDRRRHSAGTILGRDLELAVLRMLVRSAQADASAQKASAALAVVEGGSGMGRSTLAEALLQEVRGAETGQATHAGMMFQCQRGDLPFVIWHRVLCWLLEEVGAADANSLAWLLVSALAWRCLSCRLNAKERLTSVLDRRWLAVATQCQNLNNPLGIVRIPAV